MPPELNTFRLQAGAGEGPMLQAAAGWEALALAMTTQAMELGAALASLAAAWQGTANERAVTATMPMVVWLEMLALQAQKRAIQAAAQAASYATAFATTPQLPEIFQNQITHAVLEATNFLGCNIPPIGVNEMDYARMWALAAAVMDGYEVESQANVLFEPIMPMQPIVIPGVGESAIAAAAGRAAAGAPGVAMRNFAFAQASVQSTIESVAMNAGRMAAMGDIAATRAEGAASKERNLNTTVHQNSGQSERGPQQMMQNPMQMVSQMGSQLASAPQQMSQMVQSPMQQLTQPFQQATSMFTQMGGSHGQQMGFMGTSPLSNHPLTGGSGMSTGAGLVRAASLPGAGGSAPRTALLAKILETPTPPQGAAAGPTMTTTSAPVGGGSGGGAGGGAPVNAGQRKKKSAEVENKEALATPILLLQDLGDDDADDW
ncbi:PPE family protein [Mycobacterium sp. M1]|uniref:PPE family protein n=2 Tax=Mycolicibacter acidiphilus TaxID=2835306 RepID=A0ABS5RFM4_9MYCO|nr:PPE family protein [Mycolicibacter acidiphilus]